MSQIETVKWWKDQGENLEERVEDAVEVACINVDKRKWMGPLA